MSDPITIVIGGEPVAKGRPRMTQRGFIYTRPIASPYLFGYLF
jgi:hypothetical protein